MAYSYSATPARRHGQKQRATERRLAELERLVAPKKSKRRKK
jgi:hypothetical protein